MYIVYVLLVTGQPAPAWREPETAPTDPQCTEGIGRLDGVPGGRLIVARRLADLHIVVRHHIDHRHDAINHQVVANMKIDIPHRDKAAKGSPRHCFARKSGKSESMAAESDGLDHVTGLTEATGIASNPDAQGQGHPIVITHRNITWDNLMVEATINTVAMIEIINEADIEMKMAICIVSDRRSELVSF